MKPTEHLFQLIRSLTPSEKRYFQLEASKHTTGKKNNYLKLFDAIEGQKNYEEEKIKILFKGEKFIDQLFVTKNYLYHLILNSLHHYHVNLSNESKLRKQLHQVALLHQKGLYDDCDQLLMKTKKTALELDHYNCILDIIGWQKKLSKSRSYLTTSETDLLALFEEENAAFEKLRNILQYSNLLTRMLYLYNTKGEARNLDQKSIYDRIIQDPLMDSEEKALSDRARSLYNNIYSTYYYLVNNFSESVHYTKRSLELIELFPVRIKDNPYNYIAALNNYLAMCVSLGEEKEFFVSLEKMRNLQQQYKDNSSLQVSIFCMSYSMESDFYIKLGFFERGKSAITAIDKGLKDFGSKVDRSYFHILNYNSALLSFGTGDYHQALKSLNQVLNARDADHKQDIVCFSKVLQLITHYELQNTDLLPYMIRSTFRYLSRRNRMYESEVLIFNALRKLTDITTSKQLTELFNKTRKDLIHLVQSSPLEANIFNYFDFISWLESKVEKRSFADCVKKNYMIYRNGKLI